MKAITITNLTKAYKNRIAVDALNLSIDQGEFFALLGQNGAGKTTTIKMLCCLLAPTSGDACLLGDSIIDNPKAIKQKVNVSPQETAVAPNLTVEENLMLIASIYGSPKEEGRVKAKEMLETFGLKERAKDKAKNLSGGMQRRLSIAMALITRPKILFLDEPTLGLDVRARRDLWNSLLKLKGQITIILTTHYLDEVEALADRVGVMHNGKLKTVGTVAQLTIDTGKPSLEEAFLAITEQELI